MHPAQSKTEHCLRQTRKRHSRPSRPRGPPAALPVAGPSRGGGRTRGVLPSRALPHRTTATRERRHQTFANGTGPARGSCAASRSAGHVSVNSSAAALAAVLSVRRLSTSLRRAWRGFRGRSPAWRLAVRRRLAGERHRQGRNVGPKPGKSAFPARQSIQKRHRKRSERISQAYRQHKTLQPQSACPSQPQVPGRRKRPPAWLRPCVAPGSCRRGCVPAFVRRRVGRPDASCRQRGVPHSRQKIKTPRAFQIQHGEHSCTHRFPPTQPAQLPAPIQRRHRTAKDRNPKPSGLEYAPVCVVSARKATLFSCPRML